MGLSEPIQTSIADRGTIAPLGLKVQIALSERHGWRDLGILSRQQAACRRSLKTWLAEFSAKGPSPPATYDLSRGNAINSRLPPRGADPPQ
jgi:hypothetical protein